MTWLPEASAHAMRIDLLLAGLVVISLAVLGLVFGLMLLNILRFRAGRTTAIARAIAAHKSWRFEIVWTAVTLAIFFALFLWATQLYVVGFRPPAGAIQVYVTGKQWMWKVQYPGGQREINALHVPAGRPVQLLLTSEDVIHDFSIPVLRIKHDVLPGRYQSLWFTADRTGSFRFYCTQFCGLAHSRMTGTLTILSAADYAGWLNSTPASGSLAATGEALFIRSGCSGCHASSRYAPDAADTSRAPSMVGLYGSRVVLADGRAVVADAAFLHDSIVDAPRRPGASFATEMPSFRGVLSEDELAALVAYLQTLSPTLPPSAGN
ncbi:putative cytochrome c oxidase subunit II [Gluconacetobacter johannae DSM 13595]|uniref:cytochrome-c oxidase n=1 Tax=Gluconacetobacter johannae TaxID=112140 RepID=A0A7W4P2B0_9PROT|nr:cytochrome c oxidase subunit II [Gluconacetobacter johannae]MBB2174956.1 cytochrome c oxidase subunit II [Gluconacetobacter johannae]GBQ87948.1 putative cytochrome c oxidase subunit II [Gluconacetobacter johannae DSM 13595]